MTSYDTVMRLVDSMREELAALDGKVHTLQIHVARQQGKNVLAEKLRQQATRKETA